MKPVKQFYKELVQIMDEIEALAQTIKKPIIPESIDVGLDSSKRGAAQPLEVPMTPWTKTLLQRFGDLNEKKERLMVGDPQTKAEKWVYESMLKILDKYFPGPDKYDETIPMRSHIHYNTQCRQQLHENMRQVVPGQADEREEAIKEYTRAAKPLGLRQKLLNDETFQKAVELVFNEMPFAKATDEWREVNTPFMTKHSNVGNKWWKRDISLVPGSTETYGEMTLREAKNVPLQDLWKWNLSTMYGRNQRKGRLIIAVPRIINLSLNRLQAPEIEAYKHKSSMFVGYNNDQDLKRALIYILTECEKRGWKCRNVDQSRFDRHVGQEFILLENAMRVKKCNGRLSKEIAMYRAALSMKTWCVDGLSGKILELFGRIFSGEIDTNLMGGLISALINTWGNLDQDKNYANIAYSLLYWMLVMGDDCLSVYRDRDSVKFDKFMESIGFATNAEKDEYGPMFLQCRVFEDPASEKLVMAYAFTRVLMSMMWKEESKGLGPAGWYLSWLQQCAKVMEYTPALKTIVNFFLPLDEYGLFLDKPISYVIKLVEQEDSDAQAKMTTANQKRKFESTFDRLMDGDPTKARFSESISSAKQDKGYLAELHKAVKDAVDPEWYKAAGVTIPTKPGK